MVPVIHEKIESSRITKPIYIKDISHIVMRKTKGNWSLRDIRHIDWCVIVCCFDGIAEYHLPDSDLHVKTGEVLFFPQAEERSVRSNLKKPWTFCSAVFSLHESLGMTGQELSNLLGRKPMRVSKEIMAKFSNLALLWAGRTAGYRLRCTGALLDIIGCLIEEANDTQLSTRIPNYSRIKKAMNKIAESDGSETSLSMIATESGLSESRFRHLFKAATGYSPTKYANLKKIEKAKDLLLSGTFNVSGAAEELGFESVFYFSRLFKAITGQSPSVFLKK